MKREEEYFEIMYIFYKNKGVICVKDIVKVLNVRFLSVVDVFKKFVEKGFIEYEKYDRIFLIEKGREIVENMYFKYVFFMKFFMDIFGILLEIVE